MNYWQQWVYWFQQMHCQLEEQNKRLTEMEKSMEALQTEMKSWKEQKRIHIDKVEYKFDQLKVEKLDGTLNIGLTPGALEDVAVNETAAANGGNSNSDKDVLEMNPMVQPANELQYDIYRELKQFVETEVPKQIERLQAQYGQQLDTWHQKMMVEDLLKQTGPRSGYYLHQMTPGATADQLSSIKDSVLFRTRNDIRAAVESYFNKFHKKSEVESKL